MARLNSRMISAFGAADVRNIRRDSLLLYMFFVPWLMIVMIRLFVPPITAWLLEVHQFDAVPYYPVLFSLALVLQVPLIFGVLFGLMLLDERDDHTLTALQVTPVTVRGYTGYRIVSGYLMGAVYVVITLALSGVAPLELLPSFIPVALVAGLIAPLLMLVMAAFANNKLEGLALMKGFGAVMLGPLAAYFIQADWQIVFGILPSYWAAKAFWLINAGESAWGYLIVGAVYNVVLIALLLRRFYRRIHEAH